MGEGKFRTCTSGFRELVKGEGEGEGEGEEVRDGVNDRVQLSAYLR